MIKFPSIEQFKNVVFNVKKKAPDTGVLSFIGTVKLHGTNAAIVFDKNDGITFQSRNRVLKLSSDNAGFVEYMKNSVGKDNLLILKHHVNTVIDQEYNNLVIYGEWCGGNIQKGVAISELEKMFVIFAVKLIKGDEKTWLPPDRWCDIDFKEHRIFNIHTFPTYNIDIDFQKPALSQNTLVEITENVEKECPVGKYFGVSGIGEGVVWKCLHQDFNSSDYWMKVKGEKHSTSKVKTIAPVDVEKVKSILEFVNNVVTENRLQQGIDYLNEMGKPVDKKSTGDFLSWVFADIIKEESDIIIASGFEKRDFSPHIGKKAREWYFNKVEEL